MLSGSFQTDKQPQHSPSPLRGSTAVEAMSTLAQRLGVTVHLSPLRHHLARLAKAYPSRDAATLEEWLVDVANARGARVVVRPGERDPSFVPPPLAELPQEELVVALCQPQCLDRPPLLRLAAQLVSRGVAAVERLVLVAERERATRVLAELARQALRVEPRHPVWNALHERVQHARPLSDVLVHWSRLAEPVTRPGERLPSGWKLVA